jgi:hypothetical protein
MRWLNKIRQKRILRKDSLIPLTEFFWWQIFKIYFFAHLLRLRPAAKFNAAKMFQGYW